MATKPNTADFFRALDDSNLDVYEVRYVLRVWRRGKCWEKLQAIADATGMSVGKASEVRRDLLAARWLVESIYDGRVVYEVAIPDCCSVSCNENNIHYTKEHEHHMKPDFHEVKPDFHVVGALPINRQIEDHTINQNGAPVVSPVDDDALLKERAINATFDLIEFWEGLTKRRRPAPESAEFRENWFKPFNTIWITCGRSVDAAKAKVQAVRDSMLAEGRRIFDPAKLPAHVQAMVDAEMLPMTQRMNGSGRAPHTAPLPELTIVNGLY